MAKKTVKKSRVKLTSKKNITASPFKIIVLVLTILTLVTVLYLNKKLNSNSQASMDGCRWMIGNENRYWAGTNERQGYGQRLGSSCVCGQKDQATDCDRRDNGKYRCKTTEYVCKQIKTGGISGSIGRGTGNTAGGTGGYTGGCVVLFGRTICPGGTNPGAGGGDEEAGCWKCPGSNCDKCGTGTTEDWCAGHSGTSQACNEFLGL
jgi:hypothetical protein